MRSDQKLKCQRCGHVQRFHKGRCRASGCKDCSGFVVSSKGEKLPEYKSSAPRQKGVSPEDIAETFSEGDLHLKALFVAEIIWNPGIYYRQYKDHGGVMEMDGWVTLCKGFRRTDNR